MTVKHSTTAIGVDSGDGLIGKSAWNADHVEVFHGCRMYLSGLPYSVNYALDQVDMNAISYDTDSYAGLGKGTGSWSLTGTVTFTSGSPMVSGSGTSFLTELTPGTIIAESSFSVIGTVRSVLSNTLLELWQPQIRTITGGLIRFAGMTVPLGMSGYYHIQAQVAYLGIVNSVTLEGIRAAWVWRPGRRVSGGVVYELLNASQARALADPKWTIVSTSGTCYLTELDVLLCDGGSTATQGVYPEYIQGEGATWFSIVKV